MLFSSNKKFIFLFSKFDIRDFIKKDFKFKKVQRVNVEGGHLVFPREMHYKQQPELTQRNFVDNNNAFSIKLNIISDFFINFFLISPLFSSCEFNSSFQS